MTRSFADIERDIRALSSRERARLLRSLIEGLDAPADADTDQAWLAEAERRLSDVDQDPARAVSGDEVFDEARSRLK